MNRRDALRSLLTLPAVGSVAVAQVKPEDTIVITCPRRISQEMAARIKAGAEAAFPDSHVVVLGDGATLSIVRGLGA